MAAIEACTRALSRDNAVSIGLIPAHHGVLGNKKASEYVKAPAVGEGVTAEVEEADSEVSDQYRWENSLSHMTRVATET